MLAHLKKCFGNKCIFGGTEILFGGEGVYPIIPRPWRTVEFVSICDATGEATIWFLPLLAWAEREKSDQCMLPCHSAGPRVPIGRWWRHQNNCHQKCLDIKIVKLVKRHHHEKVPIIWTGQGVGVWGCFILKGLANIVRGGHHQRPTSYLSFFLHRHNFWLNIFSMQMCVNRDKIDFATKQRKRQLKRCCNKNSIN